MDCLKSKDAIPIVNCLEEHSCCHRCIIRLLGLQVSDNEGAYRNPKEYLNQLVSSVNLENTEGNVDEPFLKKLKRNVCPLCLDCFEEHTVEKFVQFFCSLNIEEYKYNNFFFNISLPKCLPIRAHSMLLYLKEKYPNFPFGHLYEETAEECNGKLLEQPHKIFRVVAAEIIAKALGKQYHPKSNLSLLIIIGYENDNLEVTQISKTVKKNTSKKNNMKISRNNMSEFLRDIDDKLFKEIFPVPPKIPDKEVLLENVTVFADPIYLGGRYLKFTRNVGQTPWLINGVSLTEYNVQDIIFDAIFNVLGIKKTQMTFTASGREDLDVRMLGTGRPFYIKIENPKQRQISPEQLLEVEREIIKTELVAVINLQSVFASDLSRIKCGEEQKKKTYKALCKTTSPNIKEAIAAINKEHEDLIISQLTVMRVLHRRTLIARQKIIHKMTASEVPGHDDLFELEVVTQAGTYVKEFVHGDFQRTNPNISSIVGYPTDIVVLDCLNISLAWPEDDPILMSGKPGK